MRTKSISTTLADPYRAGLMLGNELADIQPEVVLLFCTLHYPSWSEFIDGLYDGLDDENVPVIGSSGDGFLEAAQVSDFGAAALGIATDGKVKWHLGVGHGVHADAQAAVHGALAQLQSQLGERQPAFYFLLSDFNTDASELEAVLRDEVHVPVIGGMAADKDQKLDQCFLFANRRMVPDSVVMLACDGPISFQVHIGNSITPVGAPGRVEQANGRNVRQIDGIHAAGFVERETGKPFLPSDQGSIALTLASSEHGGEKKLRSIVQSSYEAEGDIDLYGGIEVGEMVQVCLANPTQLQQEVRRVAETARSSGFQPAAALIVSCAARKWMLGGQVEVEVENIQDAFPTSAAPGHRGDDAAATSGLPIAGFAALGEIGPLRTDTGYTRNLFHNMTYVLLLLGLCDGKT